MTHYHMKYHAFIANCSIFTPIFSTDHYSSTFHDNGEKRVRECATVLIQMHLMVCSTDTEDTKMLLDILSPVNVINNQLASNLVDNCLDDMLQKLYFLKIVVMLCNDFGD